MKKPRQFPFAAGSPKCSCLRLQFLIFTGIIFLSLTSLSCSTIRLQINQFNKKESVLPRDMISPEEDYNILRESAIIVTVNDDSGAFFIGKEQVTREQLTGRIVDKLKDQTPDKQMVYIESAENVQYGTVTSLLNLIRKSEIDKAGLVVDKTNSEKVGAVPAMFEVKFRSEFEVKFPSEPGKSGTIRKPNPLTLVVEIDKTGNLLLNKDPTGKVSETAVLTDRLTNIYKERERNGIFREGTNEVEKTIFIKAPRSFKYGDVVKVVDAVKMAGAQPIGLQIDDLID